MRTRSGSLLPGAAAALLVALAAGSARADIIYLPEQTTPSGGVGRRPESVLSIQSPGNSTNAAGGVSYGDRRPPLQNLALHFFWKPVNCLPLF